MSNLYFENLFLPLYPLVSGHEEAQMSLWETIVNSNALNVLLVLLFFFWLFNKFQLGNLITRRRDQIVSEMETAEAEKQQALAELTKLQEQTKQLSQEIETRLNEARTSAQKLSEQILMEAQAEADRIVQNAKSRIEIEQRTAVKQLQGDLLEDAIALVQQHLQTSLTEEDHHKAIDDFIETLPTISSERKQAS
jgi:F-type H+-transporting ATPase subunit b